MSKVYICTAKSKRAIGRNGERALYYNKTLHRKTIYISSYPIATDRTFRLFKYKEKENAQKLCNRVNEMCGDNFEVRELIFCGEIYGKS